MPYKDPAKKLERARQYRLEQKDAIAARKKEYRANNSAAIAEYERIRREITKDARKQYMKEYVQSDEYRARRSERRKALWRTNPNFRLSELLRSRLAYSLRNKSKLGSAVTLLGCSLHDAIAHIESQFEQGMSWENWGEWHVDHIRPLASFNLEDPIALEMACHYTNLQPLWAKENLAKGGRISLQQMLPTAGLAESYARGEMVQSDRSMKQEPTEGRPLYQRSPVGIPVL